MKTHHNFKKIILKNRVRLILIPNSEAASAGISVLVGTGSRFENSTNNGISHFLEHLVFKGTKNFRSQVLISENIEGVGGVLNGYTSSQVTSYWAKVLPRHFKAAAEVLTDLVVSPLLREKDLKSEKGVIIEEIRMKDDNPMDEVLELSEKSLWGNSSLGFNVLGSEKTIRALTAKNLVAYHARCYSAANIVVAVSGKFKESEAVELLERKFKTLPKSARLVRSKPTRKLHNFVIKKKETAQAHISFAFPTFPFSSHERYTLDVISSILGSGMSSRLFLNVRDKGLAYAIHCFNDYFADAGGFYIYAGVEKERLPLAIETILLEFKKLAREEVGLSELAKAKEKIKGPFLFSLEDSVRAAEYYGYQEAAYGFAQAPEEYLTKLSTVNAADVRDLSLRLFNLSKLSFAAISPFGRERFEKLLGF